MNNLSQYRRRITIRIDSEDEGTINKLHAVLKNIKNIRVSDVSYDTARHVIAHATREQEIFKQLAQHGKLSIGEIHKRIITTKGNASYKTIQRDIASLKLRGLVYTRKEHNNGNRTIVWI